MTAIEIAAAIASVLMLVSRFVQAAKPAWNRLPKSVAVILPPAVLLVPQVVDLIGQAKSWADLTAYLIASVAMTITGLFPKHDPATVR